MSMILVVHTSCISHEIKCQTFSISLATPTSPSAMPQNRLIAVAVCGVNVLFVNSTVAVLSTLHEPVKRAVRKMSLPHRLAVAVVEAQTLAAQSFLPLLPLGLQSLQCDSQPHA
jgi:predicted lysophospholipase L1 biosynthesis ABC-type transport system permease subunit